MKSMKSKTEEEDTYVETEKGKLRPLSAKLDLTLNKLQQIWCRILEINCQKFFGPRLERAAEH